MRYWVEVRNTADELIARLENAYNINYVAQVNAPHILNFSLPAWDSKAAYLTLANEYWLIEDDEAGTQTTIRKFKLQIHRGVRTTGLLETKVECLDYLSQLASGVVVDYSVGLIISYVAQGAALGTYAYRIREYGDYVFAVSGNYIYKYLKSDMSLVSTSPDYGGAILCLAVDASYVYAGGITTNRVRRYNYSDLTYVDQSDAFTGQWIGHIDQDATYLYIAVPVVAPGNSYAYKITKATMATAATSPALGVGCGIGGLVTNGTYVFMGLGLTGKVRKYNCSDMTYAAVESPAYSGANDILAMALDSTYVYVGGATAQTIKRYLQTTLAYVDVSPDYGGQILDLVVGNGEVYIYAAGDTTQTICRYFISDLTYSDQSPDYGGSIYGIEVDDLYVYAGGATTERVRQYSISDTVEEIVDALLAYPMQLPAVTVGTIDPAYADLIRNISADGQSILEVLLLLREMVGGYLEVDNNRQFNWLTVPTGSEDKGQQIRYHKNLTGIEREVDYTQLRNRVYVYGKNDIGTKIQLSDIQADDYVENPASQAAWGGIYVGTFVSFSVITALSLLEWANDLLAIYKDPLITYSISAINLAVQDGFDFDALHLGSTVVVIDEGLGIDVSAIVVKIEYPDLSDPQDMNVELANVVRNVADTIAGLGKVQHGHDIALLG